MANTNAGGGRSFTIGTFKNSFVSLDGGADTIEVSGLVAADVDSLVIDAGNAQGTGDTVTISNGNFVGTGGGPSSLAKSVAITEGNGEDAVNIDVLTTPSLTINTGSQGQATSMRSTSA